MTPLRIRLPVPLSSQPIVRQVTPLRLRLPPQTLRLRPTNDPLRFREESWVTDSEAGDENEADEDEDETGDEEEADKARDEEEADDDAGDEGEADDDAGDEDEAENDVVAGDDESPRTAPESR